MKYLKKLTLMVFILVILLIGESINFKFKSTNLETNPKYFKSGLLNDSMIIPDKYNTGITNPNILVKVNDINDITNEFKFRASSTELVLNWQHTVNEEGKNYVIENYDFTKYIFRFYSSDIVSQKTTIVFRNCTFSTVRFSELRALNITYIFENCTFYDTVSGSNAIFNNCRFISTTGDNTVAFVNMNYNNCLFTVIPVYNPYATHLDGIQIYGREGIKAEDVHMNNCRIIALSIEPTGSAAYVNAPIMLKLDYNNADNITFDNMHITGGGFTIYSQPNGFQMTNIAFRNILVGCTYKYGILYKSKTNNGWNGAFNQNVEATKDLYVSSVWKEGNDIHLVVTNDTNYEKNLKVVLSNGTVKEFKIKKCPTYKEFTPNMSYDEFPFDQEIVIKDANSGSIKCYDGDTLIRTKVFYEEYVSSIVLKSTPKTTYLKDSSIDLAGGVISAIYSNGINEDVVMENSMISCFNTSELGTKEVIVTYQNKTLTYQINVVAKESKDDKKNANVTDNSVNEIINNEQTIVDIEDRVIEDKNLKKPKNNESLSFPIIPIILVVVIVIVTNKKS